MLQLDTGNTGFMILCSSLVMLMTPGLAFFYGGLVGRKNVLAIMMQSFVSMGWTTVIWYVYGYSLCFSGDWHGIIGNLHNFCLRGVTLDTPSPNPTIPLIVFIAYQMMFAIITPALISGAFTNRVTFKAYFWFLTAWLTFVYFPFVHMVWSPSGILNQWGVKDFAGAGLLWFGWYGFNAGSEFAVDKVTASAFLNTDIAASFAAIAWLLVAWSREDKPKFLGLLTGAVAGLATITPAAGYVSPTTAVIIGLVAGIVCYFAVELKNKLQWDDALDVWGVHGIGGLIGILMLGLFADKAFNPAAGENGLFYGNPAFFGKQAVAVLFSSVWAFVFTFAMLKIINIFTPVKVEGPAQEIGLDEVLHGEQAYEVELLIESARAAVAGRK
ncbi:MAG: ammonium transporter [Terriglobales bacterium]